ncbi:flagellar basal body protein [Aurantimonas sp. VKM B-3413]|uniref:flagellar basal body protein n=1 Tax=Aurantimonas sp. VKM B-3413 TaxID=2779401 RepID=UPI001E5E7991|nr:flagellar basal body protein [Aurantimonas sp. VKM B-3413]MCB8837930.1 flagellar basal body protein [Aurantimonas sp. VKM B-3413]
MDQVYLFGIASQRSSWLSNRQAVVAENVANADTPGYTAKDIVSFEEAMKDTQSRLASSSPLHLASLTSGEGGAALSDNNAFEIKNSKKPVVLEQEMLKANEVQRAYSLDTSIVKAFHRMVLMTIKS